MKLAGRLRSPWFRACIVALAVGLLMTAPAFVGGRPVDRALRHRDRQIQTDRLIGNQGAAYLKTQLRIGETARREREEIIARLSKYGASEENMLVMPIRGRREPTASDRLRQIWDPNALAQTEYVEDGVLVITPFESDGNPDTAEFNAYYTDYDTGHTSWGDVQLHTADPANTITIWSGEAACNGLRPDNVPRPPDLASMLVPRLHAQTDWHGIDCENTPAINYHWRIRLKEVIKNAVLAASGAMVPCIGATIGWPACVGSAWSFTFAAGVAWESGEMLWSCRCRYLGWACP